MPSYTQGENLFRLTTPLGPDVLLLRRIRGTEGISELFDLELEALAENEADVAFEKVLGQLVTVSVHSPDGSPIRFFNGLCVEMEEGSRETLEATNKTFTSYRLRIAPKVWVLGLVHRSRVFQEKSVKEILETVFTDFEKEINLYRTYDKREMCVQYRESDLAFACRLMEEEGIRYFFKHESGSHKIVLSDATGHEDLPGGSSLHYDPVVGGVRDEDRVSVWKKKQSLTRGKVTLWDRSFELPTNNLEKVNQLKDSLTVGEVTHMLRLADADKRELYGFPGGHAKPYDGITPGGGERAAEIQKIFPYGETRARVVMEREETRAVEIDAAGTVRHLTPGYKIQFSKHHDGNGAYLVTHVRHDGQVGMFRTDDTETSYENAFTCLPVDAAYRPARKTRRPVAQGPETALVVGPAGEEIYVDKYGRIKVQFYWDREGKKDVNSCAWLRVATPLAGAQWGSYAFPRIGQEVLVAFQHGDPDEPVVIGALYNAENMPPYTLPANKVRTGLKTRSTLRAGADEFHEVRFDDTKGSEQVFVQSQKDFHRLVKNNDLLQVGTKPSKEKGDGSQRQEIWMNRTVNVSKGDDALNVGRLPGETDAAVEPRPDWQAAQSPSKGGNRTLWIANDRTTTLNWGNDKLVVGVQCSRKTSASGPALHQGNQVVEIVNDRSVTLECGNDTLTLEKGNLDIKLNGPMPGGKVTIEAQTSIELKVGQNSLKIDMTAIELKSPAVSLKIDAMSGELKTEPSSLKVDASGATLKGVMAKVEGLGMAEVKAPMVDVKADGVLNAQGSGAVNVGGAIIKIG